MPDGFSVDLDQFSGLNQIGETALEGQGQQSLPADFRNVDRAWRYRRSRPDRAGWGHDQLPAVRRASRREPPAASPVRPRTVLDQFLQIPPTITIREGHRVKVYFTQDVLVPAYDNHRIAQSF